MKLKSILFLSLFVLLFSVSKAQSYQEQYRPQVHFTPPAHWNNDPNGMVYFAGEYHLFYQYYPDGTTWGPMYWGHAISKDLIHWKNMPIALSPDSLGYIFSGSAVVDKNNTAGFQKGDTKALVAIFTYHNPKNEVETQGIAYSLDSGRTWTKYANNPVIDNPGMKDFRDPKVFWYQPKQEWIMSLASGDHIQFYSSPNLKDWTFESKFGKNIGAHGGVWECPDLFTLNSNGEKKWVLLVNMNPGGPNGGSATQYFVGDFDGTAFIPDDTATSWLDFGPDEYAGVTWSNTQCNKYLIGWLNNWQYADRVPTGKWRGGMTIPRKLRMVDDDGRLRVASEPVSNLNNIVKKAYTLYNVSITPSFDLSNHLRETASPSILKFHTDELKSFSLTLSNDLGEKLIIGYDNEKQRYYIDRRHSGKVNFSNEFPGKFFAPRFVDHKESNITLIIDKSSIELFADGGQSVMTATFFPNEPYNQINFHSEEGFLINRLHYSLLESIWRKK